MIRVIIADDHHLIRKGFKQYIDRRDDIEYVAEAETAEELMELCAERVCDLIMLDIGLPDKHGLEVLRDIKRYYPSVNVLILSMHPEERYAKRALENGASGYITKGSPPGELEKAIRKAYFGKKYISESFAEELAADVEGERSAAPHHRLSDREFEILLLIGAGRETKEIAEKLHLSVSTVHTYKQRVMKKLDLQTTAELFQYVYTHRLIDSAAL